MTPRAAVGFLATTLLVLYAPVMYLSLGWVGLGLGLLAAVWSTRFILKGPL